jgi:hypothetical protein
VHEGVESRASKRRSLLLPILAAFIFATSVALCQSSPLSNSNPESEGAATVSTTVAGIVRTAQGIPVPGAIVRVVHLASGRSWAGLTDEDGGFSYRALPAGHHRVQVKQLGFATSETEMNFEPGTPAKVQLTLHVEASTATTTVSKPVSKPADAQISPQAVTAAPKVPKPTEQSTSTVSTKNAEATMGNKSRTLASKSKSNEPPISAASAVPSEDPSALAQESAADAYLVSGTVSRAESSSGTTPQSSEAENYVEGIEKLWTQHRLSRLSSNRMHLSLHERYDSSAWDARPYSLRGPGESQPAHYDNRFGINLGGPLSIPAIYDGSQRTYFFLSAEYNRANPLRDYFATVPTASERAGDFSNRGVEIFDPTSSLTGPRVSLGSVIPQDRLDKAALGMLQFLPLPNLPGLAENFHLQTVLPVTNTYANVKVLHTISPHLNLLATYDVSIQDAQKANSLPLLTSNSSTFGQAVTLGLTQNWTPRLVNETKINWSHNAVNLMNGSATRRNIVGELGILGVSQSPSDWGVPLVHLTNFTDLNDVVPAVNRAQTFRLIDNATYTLAKHTIRAGAELRWRQIHRDTNPIPRGEYTFTGLMTSQLDSTGQPIPETGFDFADFLMGYAQSTAVRFGDPNIHLRSRGYVGFVQDSWRVHPRFAVNLGIRYELITSPEEVFNHLADLVVNSDITAAAVVTPGQVNPFTGKPVPRALINTDLNHWGPRLGIAWRPPTKLPVVFRAGYSILYDDSPNTRIALSMANEPPFAQSQVRQTTTATILTLENGFPAQASPEIGNSVGVDPGIHAAYTQVWNASLETRLNQKLLMDITYTGTKGTNLEHLLAPNRANPGSSFSTDLGRRIPYAPGFTYQTDGASSIYHGVQFRVRRQLASGLSFQGRYTFGKSIDDASSIGGGAPVVVQDDNNLRAERGLSSFDVRHQFRGSFSYEFPLGPKKRWFHEGTLSRVFGNFQITEQATISTGTPFTALLLGSAADNTGTGSNFSTRPDQIGNPNLSGDQRTPLHFFNTDAFVLPAALQYGNTGRNTITGPGAFMTDASLMKKLRFGEGGRFSTDIRWEVRNLINTPNFVGLHTSLGSSLFGSVRSTKPMRDMSLLVRVSY